MPVASVLIPRFGLTGATDRRELLTRPVAVAPEPGGPQLLGEVSGPAEALGVRAGMRVGEALSRCPELVLIPPDPEGAERAWERVLQALEGIGVAVEPGRPGEAFFEARGLRHLYGGTIEGVLRQARRAVRAPARLAAAPGRFCAYAAARRTRVGRPVVVAEGRAAAFLAPLPVSLLYGRLGDGGDGQRDDLPTRLEQLGVQTLGELAALPRSAIADRFGPTGLLALRLARGEDEPLRPRRRHEPVIAELELPEAAFGFQLERGLQLLVARLLTDPARRGRTVRAMRLGARLAAGGGWRREVTLRQASADPERLRLALAPCLAELPAPASLLRLEATALGPATGEQLSFADPTDDRRRRISEAVRQARAAAGSNAVLRVLEIDPESRLPERRAVLTPFPEQPEGAPDRPGRRSRR